MPFNDFERKNIAWNSHFPKLGSSGQELPARWANLPGSWVRHVPCRHDFIGSTRTDGPKSQKSRSLRPAVDLFLSCEQRARNRWMRCSEARPRVVACLPWHADCTSVATTTASCQAARGPFPGRTGLGEGFGRVSDPGVRRVETGPGSHHRHGGEGPGGSIAIVHPAKVVARPPRNGDRDLGAFGKTIGRRAAFGRLRV
jgi:hypothetical protein